MHNNNDNNNNISIITNNIDINENMINNYYYAKKNHLKWNHLRLFKFPFDSYVSAVNNNCFVHHIITEKPIYLNGSELLYLVHYLQNPDYIQFFPNDYKLKTNSNVELFVPIFFYQKQFWITNNLNDIKDFNNSFKLFINEEEYNIDNKEEEEEESIHLFI